MSGTLSPARIVKLLISRGWHVGIAAVALALLVLPSAPPERAAEAAVQQPFQCPRTAFWDLFNAHYYLVPKGDGSGLTKPVPIQPVDDEAPRNDWTYISASNPASFSVPFDGVIQNDDWTDALDRGGALGRPEARLIQPPSRAKDFSLNDDGSYSYTPIDGYVGGDSFKYGLKDPVGTCYGRTATVTIPPVGKRMEDDTYTVLNDAVFTSPSICSINGCGVRYNDIAVAGVRRFFIPAATSGFITAQVGEPLSVTGGRVMLLNEQGAFQFTPTAGFVGTSQFFYSTKDLGDNGRHPGGLFSIPSLERVRTSARVTINVKAPPAPAVAGPPAALDDYFETNEDTPIDFGIPPFVANDGGAQYVQATSQPANGTVVEDRCQISEIPLICSQVGDLQRITYAPRSNFHGVDSFTYQSSRTVLVTLCIGSQCFVNPVTEFDTATVGILVKPVEDRPEPASDTFTVKRGEPTVLDVLANDVDADGLLDPSTLLLQCCVTGANDSFRIENGAFVYTATGADTPRQFAYFVRSLSGELLGATDFTVNVEPNPAADDRYSTDEDTPLTIAAPGVLGNDVLGGGSLTPIGVRTTEFGFATIRADGSFTYTPPANFSGTDTFLYGHNNDAATVTVTVNPSADAPGVVLNTAECPAGVICIDNPDPDDRVNLGGGDAARLRGYINDAEQDNGTIEIDWGDGTKTTRGYPCAFAEILGCPFKLAQTETWFPPSGFCGPTACSAVLFFDFSHAYSTPPPSGLRYDITVKVTSLQENLVGQATTYATLADSDADSLPDLFDNCPDAANADQLDTDGDGLGDACDADDDGDGVIDTADNCQLVVNADQANNDGDSQGDVCDRDDDNDGVPDDFGIGFDNCQFVANADQTDTDGDDDGDACDPDDDNDSVPDATDNCRVIANINQANNDGDALGDVCDPDDDNDTVADTADNCQFVANANQANFDGDAQGDACDANDDNDALPDVTDACDFEVPQGGLDADVNGCTDTIVRLRDVVNSMSVARGTKSSLLTILNDAQKAYDRGRISQAENQLRQFIAQVNAQRGKGLTNVQANLLVAYANNIIVLI